MIALPRTRGFSGNWQILLTKQPECGPLIGVNMSLTPQCGYPTSRAIQTSPAYNMQVQRIGTWVSM
jgi:hypothetical protein